MTTHGTDAHADSAAPPWQGIHHLALATPDLDATIAFYQGVLGMAVLPAGPVGGAGPRHLFVDTGGALLHFWETPAAEIFAAPWERGRWVPGALQHLALRLPDEAALRELRSRLQTAGVEVSDVLSVGPALVVLFHDNNGMMLEATYGTDESATGRDPRTVPAPKAGAEPTSP